MAKRARREPTNITLTVRVDLARAYDERAVREDVLPPIAFDALARKLAATVLQTLADVECITIGEPARRNFGRVYSAGGFDGTAVP